ncbi:MAG: peptidylprolyl isomerase [Candidatus Lokiarchaeota archaeon]|nr:peptidylprolyl isomerase [Candidatus Lokiarchaeota archaeon]
MAIKIGDIIKVEYEGRLEDRTIFDSTELQGGEPLKFEVGARMLIRGFDDSVIGKEVGDEYEITLTPSEAYGEIDPLLVQTVSSDQLPEDLDPEVGMMLGVGDANGTHSMAWVKEVDDEFITIDMNHPLAGKTLHFKIKILETGCEPDPPDVHECGCGCNDH